MQSSRNSFLDIVKGLAIILVVLGHSIQYGTGDEYLAQEDFFDNIIFKVIYSFHMPLFMLISGYLFFYGINKYDILQLLKKKFVSLIVPILSFGALANLIGIVCVINGKNTFSVFFPEMAKTLIMSWFLWFLWSVFLNSIIVSIIDRLGGGNFYYIVIEVALLLIPMHLLYGAYSFMYPYFVIGYLTNKYHFIDRYHQYFKVICTLAFILYIVLLLWYNRECYVYTSGQFVLRSNGWHYLYLDIYRFITGLTGSCIVLFVINNVYQSLKKDCLFIKHLSVLGTYSMGIYCFQDLLFPYFRRYILSYFHIYGFASVTLTFCVILGLSIICTHMSRKSNITNTLLLGGRRTKMNYTTN